jgi:hypothetical protein
MSISRPSRLRRLLMRGSMRRPQIKKTASVKSDVRGAFSVREWCQYRGLSTSSFYKRPDEMPVRLKAGRRTIITAEADQDWRHRMETRFKPS